MKCTFACSESVYAGLILVSYKAHMVTHTDEFGVHDMTSVLYFILPFLKTHMNYGTKTLRPSAWSVCDIRIVYFILLSLRTFAWSECDYNVRMVLTCKEHMKTYAFYSIQNDKRRVLHFILLYLKYFSCTECNYANRNVVYFILLFLRPFAWAECDYETLIDVTGKEHMKTRTGCSAIGNIKSVLFFNLLCLKFYIIFVCPECDYTGRSMVLCKDHMQTHTGYNKLFLILFKVA